MQATSALVFLVVALAASASALNKIKCYSCTSENDPHCGDPINTEGDLKSKECTNDVTNNILGGINTGLKGIGSWLGLEKTPQIDGTFVCLKSSFTQNQGDGKEKKVVIRSCSLQGSKFCETVIQKSKENNMKDVFCEECSSDECNGSSSVRAAAFILIPVIALVLASYN